MVLQQKPTSNSTVICCGLATGALAALPILDCSLLRPLLQTLQGHD